MARNFGGTASDQINCGDPDCLKITGTVLSMQAWVTMTVANENTRICGKGDITQGKSVFGLQTFDTHFYADCGDDSAPQDQTSAGTTTISAGAWYHVVMVKDGTGASALRLYTNGVLDATATSNKSLIDGGAPFKIGNAGPDSTRWHNGKIADVAVWRHVLSPFEIKELYKGLSPLQMRPDRLAAYFPLNGGSTTEEAFGEFGRSAKIYAAVSGTTSVAGPLGYKRPNSGLQRKAFC